MSRGGGDPLRVGLVGCGRIAQTHLDALKHVSECRLVGVADVRPDVARSVGAQYETAAHDDHRQLLDGGLDAVILCTPPSSHTEIAGFFLDEGVHVLCEKPLAVTLSEAEQLVAKAERSDRLLMMASKFRYVDDIVKAKGIIDSGILGAVILFENVFCSKVDMRQRWNARRELGGGGVLIDNGTHSVDIARFLLGPIVKVRAEEGRRVQGLDVEDTCRLFFRTDGDALGAVDLSWSIHKERDAYIEIFGPDGTLSIGWKGSKYRQSEKLEWVTFGKGYDKLSAFGRQLRNFARSIQGREAPWITAEDSLESVCVIEAAYQSMALERWVEVAGAGRGGVRAGER
jgi:predicted dehydrogenase